MGRNIMVHRDWDDEPEPILPILMLVIVLIFAFASLAFS